MPEVNALTKQVTNRERQVRYGGVFLLTLGILFWSLGVSVSYAAEFKPLRAPATGPEGAPVTMYVVEDFM
jgi:hypothetical protein